MNVVSNRIIYDNNCAFHLGLRSKFPGKKYGILANLYAPHSFMGDRLTNNIIMFNIIRIFHATDHAGSAIELLKII